VVVPVLVELGPGEVWRGALVPLVVTHDDPYASPNKEIGTLPTSAPKLVKKSGIFSFILGNLEEIRCKVIYGNNFLFHD
jgi:hypothetical protein